MQKVLSSRSRMERVVSDTAEIYRIKYQLDRYLKIREVIRQASGESILLI